MEKLIISVEVGHASRYDFDSCSAKEIKEYIEKIISEHGEEVYLNISESYDNSVEFTWTGRRFETDAEMARRIDVDFSNKKRRRQQYEQLKKEFE